SATCCHCSSRSSSCWRTRSSISEAAASALLGPFQAGANTITKLLEHCRPPLRLPYRSALSPADPAASAVPRPDANVVWRVTTAREGSPAGAFLFVYPLKEKPGSLHRASLTQYSARLRDWGDAWPRRTT